MSSVIRIAVVGYGYWGPNVARNFSALPDCELRAICDPDPARLEAAHGLYPAVSLVQEFEDLLDDDDSAAPVGHADDDDSAAPPKASGQSE